jgi:hypothetical protein
MEHIIHSSVLTHLENTNILSDEQHGFRKRRSCDTQLVLTIHDLAKALDSGDQIDGILLNFSKAIMEYETTLSHGFRISCQTVPRLLYWKEIRHQQILLHLEFHKERS